MSSVTLLKCTSCYVDFSTIDNLKTHHKCDWHRYNMKRKLAEKPPVSFEVFTQKLELLAQSNLKGVKGNAHLKQPSNSQLTIKPDSTVKSGDFVVRTDHDTDMNPELVASSGPTHTAMNTVAAPSSTTIVPDTKERTYASTCHCLFDDKVFPSLDANVSYMEKAYSFFIPDREYLKDLDGLIRYLGDKLYLGHQCLYCNRSFRSVDSVKSHMISKGHTSIGTSTEEQQEEMEPFYDFSDSYKELNLPALRPPITETPEKCLLADDNDEWEEDDSGESPRHHSYHRPSEDLSAVVLRYGLKPAYINDNGNLVLPHGREVAHRSIAYVYRQRLPMQHKDRSTCLALEHAKQARAMMVQSRQGTGVVVPRGVQVSERMFVTRARQKFDLRVGIRNNKLQRIIRRAEKYFI